MNRNIRVKPKLKRGQWKETEEEKKREMLMKRNFKGKKTNKNVQYLTMHLYLLMFFCKEK